MFTSMPSAAWSPGLPPDRAESSSPPHVSTAATTRRRRGLSYLRSYTHNHILSRDRDNGSSRASPTAAATSSSPVAAASTSTPASPTSASPTSAFPPPATPTGPPTSPVVQRQATHPTSTVPSQAAEFSPSAALFPAVRELCGVPSDTVETPSTARAPSSSVASTSSQPASDSGPPASMGRARPVTAGNISDMPQPDGGATSRARNDAPETANGQEASQGMPHQLPSIRFTAHQDPRAQRPSLVFSPQARILPSGKEIIKVGRWSERDNRPPPAANVPSAAPVGFKSKVVSRRHCEFWCSAGRWFIKDVKSSSGTFLNHIRLSSPGTESKPFPVNDGDIVQLGIDFKGGEEMIFRCVKIRIELNKGWQITPSSFKYVSEYTTSSESGLTSYSVQSHKRLQELNNHGKPATGSSSQDCSICLGPIAVGACYSSLSNHKSNPPLYTALSIALCSTMLPYLALQVHSSNHKRSTLASLYLP